jgi:hypothetical protein
LSSLGAYVPDRQGLVVLQELAELVAARAELTARIEAHIDALAANGVRGRSLPKRSASPGRARQAHARRHTAG